MAGYDTTVMAHHPPPKGMKYCSRMQEKLRSQYTDSKKAFKFGREKKKLKYVQYMRP